MEFILVILKSGWDTLLDYLSLHVLTCLIPALFIAGAISVFVSQAAVLKYFGPKANKFMAYGVGAVSGTILAVCSCTVLPLFSGIYIAGAGLGPAIAFLYSGPAINILAITYSARLLGWDIGLARVIGAVFFAGIIGLLMAFIFRKDEKVRSDGRFDLLAGADQGKPWWKEIIYFVILVGVLLAASAQQWIILGVLFISLFIVWWRWFTLDEFKLWMKETWRFLVLIVPWLLVGVFIAGILKAVIPQEAIVAVVGGNTILGNLVASLFGALMYFATLTEVPIVKAFLDMGMGKGPALALLLAGPALSLPSMLALGKIMGWKKTLVYVVLVSIMATITGYIFGLIVK
ncbi:MAG: permease [Dehalococcoidia bacterium]|nr:permease [Dehalococcoidia bacterium]